MRIYLILFISMVENGAAMVKELIINFKVTLRGLKHAAEKGSLQLMALVFSRNVGLRNGQIRSCSVRSIDSVLNPIFIKLALILATAFFISCEKGEKQVGNQVSTSGVGYSNPDLLSVYSNIEGNKELPVRVVAWYQDEVTDSNHLRFSGQLDDVVQERYMEVTPAYEKAWGMGFYYDSQRMQNLSDYTHYSLTLKSEQMTSGIVVGFDVAVEGKEEPGQIEYIIPKSEMPEDGWKQFVFEVPKGYSNAKISSPFFIKNGEAFTSTGSIKVKDILFSNRSQISMNIPESGKTALIIGQDSKSIKAYLDAFNHQPHGFMAYTSINTMGGLDKPQSLWKGVSDPNNILYADGVMRENNWKPDYINLGVMIMDYAKNKTVDDGIIQGKYDDNIQRLKKWIEATESTVILRIGYECDYPIYQYDPQEFVAAYQYIFNKLVDGGRPENLMFLWHSATMATFDYHSRFSWYPGDDMVDIFGISVFRQYKPHGGMWGSQRDIDEVYKMAKARNKPLMIAESTAFGGITDNSWRNWFAHVQRVIDQYDVRLFSYINTDWEQQVYWKGQGWGDTRIEANPKIKKKWETYLQDERFTL